MPGSTVVFPSVTESASFDFDAWVARYRLKDQTPIIKLRSRLFGATAEDNATVNDAESAREHVAALFRNRQKEKDDLFGCVEMYMQYLVEERGLMPGFGST